MSLEEGATTPLAVGALTRWVAVNVAVAQDPAGNLKPAKDKSTGRTDGIVAAIMAIGRAMCPSPMRIRMPTTTPPGHSGVLQPAQTYRGLTAAITDSAAPAAPPSDGEQYLTYGVTWV